MTSRTLSTWKSRRPHCKQRVYFGDASQFGSQNYSDASSNKIRDAKAAVDKEGKKLKTIPAWHLEKVKRKKEVILEAQRDKRKVHFAALMDICHPKNAEFEPKLQKYTGRVVLCGDLMKDDSGAYAVFTEQGSSASQMTAAKVMDVMKRLPDCDGQAAYRPTPR